MKGHWRKRAWTLLLCFAAGVAGAQGDTPPEPSQRQLQYHEHHRIELDGRTVSTYRSATRILAQTALEQAKQATLTVSRSAQRLQVLEAYTLKPNGRRIDVPRASWQISHNSGRRGESPIFSDHDSTTLVYPDLAVGDTVVLAYRITTREPLFPGKVSLANSFSPTEAFDDVKVQVDAPEAMPLKTAAFEMKESQSVQRGRRLFAWTWRNPQPVAQTRRDWSVVDVDTQPGYLLSSFTDWDDVARSYVQRAQPKAAVTPAVRELAARLTAGQTGVYEQARAIHEWVATQVGYAGNCVGIGSVVPRDLDVVLKHRLGDCKDHATLLQALLAAQGIESHQVLVNTGSLYRLPKVPVASLVNHVLNYIPALDLFADSTASYVSFGRLPFELYAKPVLSDDPKVPRQLPADRGGNEQTMKTTLVIGEDGSLQGRVEVEVSGLYALRSRARFRALDARQRQDFVRDIFRQAKLQAEGTVEADDPAPLRDQFRMAANLRVSRAIAYPGTGGLPIAPWFYNEAPVLQWAQVAALPPEDVESTCGSGRSVEIYEITLPESMRVVALPESSAIDTPMLAYEASYKLDGRQLSVRRVLDDRTPPGICSAAQMREFRDATQAVLKDVRQQLLFR